MAPNEPPTLEDRSDAIRIALAGLASGERSEEILSKLGAASGSEGGLIPKRTRHRIGQQTRALAAVGRALLWDAHLGQEHGAFCSSALT
jgi:hypothetical protein